MTIQPPDLGVSADALGFANRAQDLMTNHPYLDHPTVTAIALNSNSSQQADQQAQTVAQAISQTWDGYAQTWADPTLQAQPSVRTGLVQYIHDTIGAPPIDAGTISQLQASLQADGLGKGLSTDGAWTPDWQQQYNQALEQTRAAQLAGDKPGSVKTSSALHSFLGHLTVTGALDSITGWVKSIPGDVRQLGADSAAVIGNIPHDIGEIGSGNLTKTAQGIAHLGTLPLGPIPTIAEGKHADLSATALKVGGAVQGTSAQQYQADLGLWRALNDVNTVLTFTGAAGVAKKAVSDIGANIARGTLEKGAPELARQPGVIAKTLFNGADNGRLLGSKWVGNLPGVARVTPIVGKIAGQDGYYYTARTFLAQPYKYAAVRAAGQAFSRTQLTGLGLYGEALATSKLPGNTEAQSVLGDHTFDAINHNITQYGPRIAGWSPLDLNNLMLFLHGPVGAGTAGSASSAVGAHMDTFVDGFAKALGEKGVTAAFQQATGMSVHDMVQAAGGDSKFLAAFQTSKVSGYAQDWYADRKLGEQLNGAQVDQKAVLTAAKAEYRAMTPVQKTQVVQDMLASDPSFTYLTTRISGDIARGKLDPKAALRSSLAQFKDETEQFQRLHANGDLAFLNTPKGQALLDEEAAFHNAANLPPDFGSAAHVQRLNPNLVQDLGLANVDTLVREDVLNRGGIADQFAQQIKAAGDDPVARQAVADKMSQHLYENHNLDARAQGVFGATNNPEKLLELVKSEAQDLASDTIPTWDMPEATAARIAALRAAGKKIVVGDHLGDFYTGNLPSIGANDHNLTFLRKWAGRVSLDPARVPDQEVGRATRQSVVSALTDVWNDPRVEGRTGPYQTPLTALSMLSENGGVRKELSRVSGALFNLTAKVGMNKTEIDYLRDNMPGIATTEQARAELEQRLAGGLGLRDLPRKAMFEALTTTHNIETSTGAQWTWTAVPPDVANLILRGINRGYKLPGYIMGWQQIENWARAGYGIGDALATRYPGSNLLQNVANWPNRVVQVRNRLRFTLSPVFDTRRWTKQSAKMAAEGVQPVGDPLQSLLGEGAAKTAQNLLLRIGGKTPELNDQMDTDRMLAGRSIFGVYNPQWHAAYFVNELRKAGKSDTEMKAAYDRVFKYGTGGGTSPLERSVNTVFFPFSFEKTLLRNLGGYLLDRPAQALALDLAVDEWRKWDGHSQIGKFVDDHFPLLWEMNSLNNAFTHGISPGQLGGINAPIVGGVGGLVKNANKALNAPPTDGHKSLALLNLFLPQNWGANLTAKNLQRYMPVWGQFQKVWQAAVDQTQIGTNALYDTVGKTMGATTIRPTLTPLAQQQYGTREKVKLIDSLSTVLEYNGQQADDANKIKWTSDTYVPPSLVGQPISKTTIGEVVQQMYPHYDPAQGTAYAQQQAKAEAAFIAQVTARDPAKGQAMQQFAHLANQVIGKINRNEFDPQQLAQIQNILHEEARGQASTDPDWQTLYSNFFGYALGPIKSPTGKAAA